MLYYTHLPVYIYIYTYIITSNYIPHKNPHLQKKNHHEITIVLPRHVAELVRTRLGLCCTGAREDCAPTEVPWTPAAGRTGVKCRPGWGAFGAKQLGFQV